MKTKKFFSNSVKAAFAVMTTVVMTMGMTACSDDDEYLVDDEMTRGGGAAPVSYVERSWDGTKVVSTVKYVTDYQVLSEVNKDRIFHMESGKWYVVKSNFEQWLIHAPAGKPANL
ncbi:MAG: hypothetical protein IIZ97_04195 [Prevotella sp.]|nr:hypothetical protein [Prevotella sp.]